MNNVTFLLNVSKPKEVKLVPINVIYEAIVSDRLINETNALHMLYNKSVDEKSTPEERDKSKINYSKLKNSLPMVVFSGEFSEKRNESLTLYWSRLVLDIDHIPDDKTFVKTKKYFTDLPYTIMAFKSPSGKGLKVVLKITDKGHLGKEMAFHAQAYEAVVKHHQKQLSKWNVKIDTSGKDISRGCYLCADKNAYFNIDADMTSNGFDFEYKEIIKPEKISEYKRNNWYNYVLENNVNTNRGLVEDLLTFCETHNIDLTDSYEKWLTIMWALKQSLGDEGYPYFVSFSKNYKEFNEEEVKKKWDDNKIDPNKPIVTLGSIVHLCKQYGYTIHKDFKSNKEFMFNSLADKLFEEKIFIRNEIDTGIKQIKRNDRWETLTDIDVDDIRTRLFHWSITKADTEALLNSISPQISRHIEFIESLPEWDGKDRFKELSDTLHTEEEFPLKELYIRKWIIGAVAQLHNDGYNELKNENVIILTGPQYSGKSRWCVKLLPTEWQQCMATKNVDLTQKDDHIMLSEKFIAFLDEGVSLRKNDIRALKTLLSSTKFTGRPAYGRYNRDFIRYCSFIASTNDDKILADDTGSRRFWVIPIIKMDHDHEIDMYQVWAQAYKLFKDGEQYWLTDTEYKEISSANASFEIENPDEYYVRKHVKPGNNYFCATEIRDHILAHEPKHVANEINVYNIGRALSKLKYKRIKKRLGNENRVVYVCDLSNNTLESNELISGNIKFNKYIN